MARGRCEATTGEEEVADTFEGYAEWLDDDERDELSALDALESEVSDYNTEWPRGVTLVRDSYFETYAQELADDIGAIDRNTSWPMSCIDWEQAARELQQDYTSVDFDGTTYWVG